MIFALQCLNLTINKEKGILVKKLKPQVFDFDYKTCTKEVLFEKFQTSQAGLSEAQAQDRLAEYGSNEAARKQKRTLVLQFVLKFFHPLVVLLIVIAGVTFWTGDVSADQSLV